MRQILFLSILFAIPMRTLASDGPLESAKVIQTFLKAHCLKCHSDEKPRGKVSLEKLTTVTKENAKLWQRALTQLALGEMPPDGRPRPKLSEREAVLGWIVHSLTKVGVDPKLPGGALPEAGNLIDHERLFSGQFNGPASSPPRFWRKSQPQYDALMERLWIIPRLRYEKAHTRRDAKWAGYGYSRPFPSLDPERFTNYSGSVHADEATLRALMDAGGQIAERLTSEKPAYDKFLQPPIAVGVPSVRKTSSFRRFLIDPPSPPKEYAPFMAKRTTTHEQQQNAIRRTFQLILSRKPLS